jgi:ABC-type sugar transport system substrate-binding protein
MNKLGRVIRLATLSVLLGWASNGFAATQNLQSTLAFVYPMADGSFVLGFTQGMSFCQSPNSPQYFYVTPGQNGVNADGAKAMLATALTAFATGKTLSIAFDDSTPSCYINRFSMQ